MVGISYEGMAQFFTAAFAPAGLACIVPQYPGLPQCYVDGGLAISGFARTWEALHKGISEDEPSAPVDGPDGHSSAPTPRPNATPAATTGSRPSRAWTRAT